MKVVDKIPRSMFCTVVASLREAQDITKYLKPLATHLKVLSILVLVPDSVLYLVLQESGEI